MDSGPRATILHVVKISLRKYDKAQFKEGTEHGAYYYPIHRFTVLGLVLITTIRLIFSAIIMHYLNATYSTESVATRYG